MGTLAHFNLAGIRALHSLKSFVETGTAQGDGVAMALAAGFDPIYSVEVMPEVAQSARARFKGQRAVEIFEGDSRHCLPEILKELPREPALFWLDAHFPGAHGHGQAYDAEPDLNRRLPLHDEIDIIRKMRGDARDVLLIDDARIYQAGPYGAGDLPPDWAPIKGLERNINFIRAAYGDTHGVVCDYADHGYLMIFPRTFLKQAA